MSTSATSVLPNAAWRALARPGWTAGRLLALLFVLVALPTCALLAILTPPGQVADEPAHALRAASVLGGQLVGRRAPILMTDGVTRIMAGVDADPAVLSVMEGPNWPKLTSEYVAQRRAQAWTGSRQFFQVPNVAIYMPAFYVPAALGMAAAKLAGVGPNAALLAGRLVNVGCFLLVGVGALLLARRGHGLLFCTLTFPMTLSLGGSVNQDGLLIGASVLAAALLTRCGPTPGPPRGWPFWTAAGILTCISIVKPPYAALYAALLLPLPPPREWLRLRSGLPQRVGIALLLMLPVLLWAWYVLTFVSTPYDRPPYEAGPLWPGSRPAVFESTSPAAQVQVLLANPLLALTIPWSTIIHDSALLPSAIGALGWLNVLLPAGLYTVWRAAFGAALLSDCVAPARQTARHLGDFALMLAAAAACVLAIYLSQYLAWTAVGKQTVDGPSGRYLLPILPFLATSLPQAALPFGGVLRAACLALPVAAAAAGVVVLPMVIVAEFYLR